jgi:hypothetical protein
MARYCTHPKTRSRRERALAQRERQLNRMLSGMMPVKSGPKDESWVTADYYEARHGDPAKKIAAAETDIRNLKIKLGIS